jgi:hypothetical protein
MPRNSNRHWESPEHSHKPIMITLVRTRIEVGEGVKHSRPLNTTNRLSVHTGAFFIWSTDC